MAQDGIFGVQYLALPLSPLCDVGFPSVLPPLSQFLGESYTLE